MSSQWGPFARLLEAFQDQEMLGHRVAKVLAALPREVQDDFLEDPRFRISKVGKEVPSSHGTVLALPAPDGQCSRCVVLKLRLASCSEPFGLYVIAHELAHAYLRNGSWGEYQDPEEAADELAKQWGFPRPQSFF
jgi:hypothetical protein